MPRYAGTHIILKFKPETEIEAKLVIEVAPMGEEGEGAYSRVVGELESDTPYALAHWDKGGRAIGIVYDARRINIGEETLTKLDAGDKEMAIHEFTSHKPNEGKLLLQVTVREIATHGIGVDKGNLPSQ